MSKFFNKLPKPEKQASKTVTLNESDWQMIESYLKYGEEKVGFSINLNALLREVIIGHIESDRDFSKKKSTAKTDSATRAKAKKSIDDLASEPTSESQPFWNSSISLSR
jgi:hypothetical protein